MRPVTFLAVCASSLLSGLGCSSPPRPPDAPSAPATPSPSALGGPETLSGAAAEAPEDGRAPDPVPRVVRRLVAEVRDLVSRSDALAQDLPDPDGRRRSLSEVDEIARDLAAIEADVGGASSDELDAIVDKVHRLDTRVSLLHERLRAATNHTTAVLVE